MGSMGLGVHAVCSLILCVFLQRDLGIQTLLFVCMSDVRFYPASCLAGAEAAHQEVCLGALR